MRRKHILFCRHLNAPGDLGHLAGYACTAEESSAAVLSGRLGAAEEAAARLVAFEGGLLGAQAAALEGRPAEAA